MDSYVATMDGRSWHPCCLRRHGSAAEVVERRRPWLRGATCALCGSKSAGCKADCWRLPPAPRPPARFAEWGHWQLSFWTGTRDQPERAIAALPFAVGAQGPIDGTLGSDLRESYRAACGAWVERGELPEGARCAISQKWLYAGA